MASNRSTAKAASAETSKSALIGVARHAARIQIAALTATGNAVAGWAHAADRLAQAVGDELLRRVDGEVETGELIARVASATNVHLRELTALPSAAADHFNARLSRVSINH
jgi:hypothetical protein